MSTFGYISQGNREERGWLNWARRESLPVFATKRKGKERAEARWLAKKVGYLAIERERREACFFGPFGIKKSKASGWQNRGAGHFISERGENREKLGGLVFW